MKKSIKNFIKSLLEMKRVINYIIRNRSFHSPLNVNKHPNNNKTAIVLCNGPSLKEELPLLKYDEQRDYVVVNYFGLDDSFVRLKPKYYCLADPMFIDDSQKNKFKDKIISLFNLLNNAEIVNWELTIFIPIHMQNKFIKLFGNKNKNITVVGVNTVDVNSSWRHYVYKKGWGCPIVQTVANLAIYVMINYGYKTINLYGVDHTFMEGLCVDDNNVVCHVFRHYYNDDIEVKPVEDYLGQRPKLSEEFSTYVNVFRSHEKLEEYSILLECQIINKTKGSMIDSYKRG